MKLLTRFVSFCSRPRAAWTVIGLGMLLGSPALFSPPIADDLIHQMRGNPDRAVKGFDDPDLPLFVFADGDPVQRAAVMEEGAFGWWTAEDLTFAFWRPLSAATHHLDTELFGDHNGLVHAHSLLWFFLLLVAISRLYRRLHGPPIAVLALALYAFDDARGMVLSFASNRNALIAAFFGVCALVAHDRWRRDGWRPGAVLGPVLLAVGLLSGESALATTGFLFAHALFLDRGSLGARLAPLLPYAVLVIAWQLVYSHLGYGIHGSGIYVHPLTDTARFAAKLVERAPVLALGQLAMPASDLWLGYPFKVKLVVYPLALVVLLVVGRLLRPHLQRDPTLRFWTLGAVLALVPISATFANDRLLVFVGIGASGALACLFSRSLESPPARWARGVIVGLVGIHLVLAPLTLPARALTTLGMDFVLQTSDASLPTDPGIAQKTHVVLQAPADGVVAYTILIRARRGLDRPRTVRLLSSGDRTTHVTRLDARTLRVSPEGGFYATPGEQMVRDPRIPFAVGETVTLSDMTVTITRIDEHGRAMEADFRFASPLEHPEWHWTTWCSAVYVPWTPPPVGETVTLPSIWSAPSDLEQASRAP